MLTAGGGGSAVAHVGETQDLLGLWKSERVYLIWNILCQLRLLVQKVTKGGCQSDSVHNEGPEHLKNPMCF